MRRGVIGSTQHFGCCSPCSNQGASTNYLTMKIHCTRGCVCDCLTIDGIRIDDIDDKTRELLLDKIQHYLLTKKLNLHQIEDFVSQCLWSNPSSKLIDKYQVKEDEETCEISFNNHSINDTPRTIIDSFIKEYIQLFKAPDSCAYTFLVRWFMQDLIGLKYQYTCEECGDSVSSRTIYL